MSQPMTEQDAKAILEIAEGSGTNDSWCDSLVARLARGWLDLNAKLNAQVKP